MKNGYDGNATMRVIVRVLYGIVIAFGVLLTAITFHSFHPVVDPISPVSFLDRVSFAMGVHEKSVIVILDIDAWSTSVYTYVFHRHISDGTFHVAEEKRDKLMPGLFGEGEDVEARIDDVLDAARSGLPDTWLRLRLRPSDCQSPECRPPVLARVTPEAARLPSSRAALQRLHARLRSNSSFYYQPERSIGMMDADDKKALTWFAVSLLRHDFAAGWAEAKSAVIVDVGKEDLHLTMAGSSSAYPAHLVASTRTMVAFGNSIKLVNLRLPGLGLHAGRRHVFGLSSRPNVTSTREGLSGIDVRTACVNPVCDAFWQDGNTTYRVRGQANGTYELVKERNGPFAGKKVNLPVAKYDYCHRVCHAYVESRAAPGFDSARGRPIYMAGLLREKCVERGLTLPDRGGDVKMRLFLESLKHACKVPNTEQPFACVDLMFLANVLEQVLGIKRGTVLHATREVTAAGLTSDWPLAAAFHIHQNGL